MKRYFYIKQIVYDYIYVCVFLWSLLLLHYNFTSRNFVNRSFDITMDADSSIIRDVYFWSIFFFFFMLFESDLLKAFLEDENNPRGYGYWSTDQEWLAEYKPWQRHYILKWCRIIPLLFDREFTFSSFSLFFGSN